MYTSDCEEFAELNIQIFSMQFRSLSIVLTFPISFNKQSHGITCNYFLPISMVSNNVPCKYKHWN